MSRDTEKLLKELQSFLMQHGDEAADEDSMDRLAEQFLSEQGIHPVDENAAPKPPMTIWILRSRPHPERSASSIFIKALELEPDNVDAQLQLIVHTMEHKVDEQLPALQRLMETAAKQLEPGGVFQRGRWRVLGDSRDPTVYARLLYLF